MYEDYDFGGYSVDNYGQGYNQGYGQQGYGYGQMGYPNYMAPELSKTKIKQIIMNSVAVPVSEIVFIDDLVDTVRHVCPELRSIIYLEPMGFSDFSAFYCPHCGKVVVVC